MKSMNWSGWGDPDDAMTLPPHLLGLLEQLLGVKSPARRTVDLDEVDLPPSVLPEEAQEAIAAIVGAENIRTDAAERIAHTRGKSTVDLLRIRGGDAADAPDAIVAPASHDEILAVLRACAGHRVAVVPFGGGTSVVGGLVAARSGFAGLIALDLARLDALVSVDPVSRIATLEPGLRGPDAERLLNEQGFTLGHFPQSYEYATIGGFAATRSSGQYSAGYGRFDDMVVGLRVATPVGPITVGRAPRSAAGPDLRQLFLGSEGTFGVITAVTVRVSPVPTGQAAEGWRFPTFDAGLAAVRRLAQDGPLPTLLRLSDPDETVVNATISGTEAAGGCVAVVGYQGERALRDRTRVEEILRSADGVPLGAEPGEQWLRGRFQAPYLRDALIDAGAIAETIETAAFWGGLPALYAAVRDALVTSLSAAGTAPLVLCHVSHVYAAGASLYFTVVCASTDDPIGQWQRAKVAANTAILAAGGTITHHHGVGTDHAPGLAEEVGPLALNALRAVKDSLDPQGILNPGVLLG